MSKKGKGGDGGFQNRAARKFKENNKVSLMSQQEIFEIMDEDLHTILEQITDSRTHKPGAKYPTYTGNMFANLSVPLYLLWFIRNNVKVTKKGKLKTDELSEDEIESMKQLLADAFKRSSSNQYQNQVQEFADRNKMLLQAFALLDPKRLKIAKKLKLDKHQTRTLLIQTYGEPKYNMRFVHKIFNASAVPEKKKLKIMKKLYGDRFYEAVGAAMTVSFANSDMLAQLFEFIKGLKKKKRTLVLMAYAEAYKLNGTSYHQLTDKWADSKKNRKIIRKLRMLDIGYKKAFKHLNQVNTPRKGSKSEFEELEKKEKKEKKKAEARQKFSAKKPDVKGE